MGIEIVVNIALLFGAVFCFWNVGVGVPPSPIPGAMTAADWPRIILTCLIIALVLNIIALGKAARDPATKKEITLKEFFSPKFLLASIILIVYSLMLEYTGFLATTFVFVAVFSYVIGLKKPLTLFLGSFLSTVCIYGAFQLGLQVMLPRGVGIFRDVSIWLEVLTT